jgi:hypothetical protein
MYSNLFDFTLLNWFSESNALVLALLFGLLFKTALEEEGTPPTVEDLKGLSDRSKGEWFGERLILDIEQVIIKR